jgi:hypothetical protein
LLLVNVLLAAVAAAKTANLSGVIFTLTTADLLKSAVRLSQDFQEVLPYFQESCAV